MLKDPGAGSNRDGYEEGRDPNASFIAKALHDKPIAKFLAATAVGMVSMKLAGDMVRGGGKAVFRLGVTKADKLQTPIYKDIFTRMSKDLDSATKTLDEWEGVFRAPDGTKIPTRKYFSDSELASMRNGGSPPAAWSFRDEVQSKLVSQARRLPYELPALYISQRAPGIGTDDLFGYGHEDNRQVNWANPFDVIGDFTEQSARNIGSFLLPIEIGPTVLKRGMQGIMQHSGGAATSRVKNGLIDLDQSLKMLGHSAADLIDKSVRTFGRSTASVSAGISEAVTHYRSTIDILDEMSTSAKAKGYKAFVKDQVENGVLNNEMLDAIGPAGHARHFFKGFRGVWKDELGGEVNTNSFNYRFANRRAYQSGKTKFKFGKNGELVEVDAAAARSGSTGSDIEQIAYSIRSHVGTRGLMPTATDMARDRGSWYGSKMDELYKDEITAALERNLKRGGTTRSPGAGFERAVDEVQSKLARNKNVDSETIREIVDLLTVKTRPYKGMKGAEPYSRRFGFGDLAGKDNPEYVSDMKKYMEKRFPGAGSDVIEDLFGAGRAIGSADAAFLKNIDVHHKSVEDLWGRAFKEQILPFAQAKTGRLAVTRDAVEDLSDQSVVNFLTEQTAIEVNKLARRQGTNSNAIPLNIQAAGNTFKRTSAELAGDLQRYGFSTPEQMRNFLQAQRVVSKRSNTGGFNFLGLRNLTVEDALDKQLFSPDITPTIKALMDEMDTSRFHRIKAGSMWETVDGRIIDLSSISSGARKVVDSLGENFQIPIVKMNPVTLLGGEAERTMAETPIFRMTAGRSQPFAGAFEDTDAWLFMREKRSKGRLARITKDGTEKLDGYYRAASTDPYSMLGRHVRYAIGDDGLIPDDPRNKEPGWFASGRKRATERAKASKAGRSTKRGLDWLSSAKDWAASKSTFFDKTVRGVEALGREARVNMPDKGSLRTWFSLKKDKSENIFGMLSRRMAGRSPTQVLKGDKPEDLADPRYLARLMLDNSPEGKAKLQGLLNGDDSDELVRAFQDMSGTLGLSRIDDSAIRKVIESGDPVKDLFTVDGKSVAEIGGKHDYIEAARALHRSIWSRSEDDDIRAALEAAYDRLVGRHYDQAVSQGRYLEGKVGSQALRRRGVFTRLEEAKRDMANFNIISQALEGGNEGFATVSADLMGTLSKLRSTGAITKSQYMESRAALLSMQIGFDDFTGFSTLKSDKARIAGSRYRPEDMGMIGSLAESADPFVREALEDFAEARFQTGKGRGIKGFFARRTGGASYDYEGIRGNPFGGQADVAYVPTFGTTFQRNRLRATGSVLGVNTWSDPESFSGMSIPMAHGMQRLNNFLTPFGLGLQETDFRGPLDFYARGLVGKRVLPLFAGGATLLAADRTLGGMLTNRDEEGEKVYRPLVLGGAAFAAKEAQIALAGIPGGQTMAEKRFELEEGEVAIRKGRWWPMGNTPFKGGEIEYFRPSWYRRLMSGHTYTEDTHGTPLERLAFGHDFSPLRPISPYHYENKHYNTRPYPVTGDYFTGPWGPLTDALNMTVGRVLKPRRTMHEEELNYKLSAYAQIGDNAIAAPIPTTDSHLIVSHPGAESFSGYGYSGSPAQSVSVSMTSGAMRTTSYGGVSASSAVGSQLADINRSIVADAAIPAYVGGASAYGTIALGTRDTSTIMQDGAVMNPGSTTHQLSSMGYRAQELLGIYGFGLGALRSSLGLGNQDMSPQTPVLQSSSGAYSIGGEFWDMALGGLGDVPMAGEGSFGGLEISEFFRRFLVRERSDINYINPIANDMGRMHPWLPGPGSFDNFHEGDPYSLVQMGEARLPGKGYERFNELHPDIYGRYGILDQFKILGDVAPYSPEYRELNKIVDRHITSPDNKQFVDRVRTQVHQKTVGKEFSEYRHSDVDYETVEDTITGQLSPGVFMTRDSGTVKLAGVDMVAGTDATDLAESLIGQRVSITYNDEVSQIENYVDPAGRRASRDVQISLSGVNINQELLQHGAIPTRTGEGLREYDGSETSSALDRLAENLRHKDNVVSRKLFGEQTAVEEWESRHVYGSSFPQWQSPIESFAMPAIYKATNRGPLLGALALGTIGSMFGVGPRGKTVGSLIGSTVGLAAGSMRFFSEYDSDERFMPEHREKELAVEEYTDILSYVRSMRLKNEAELAGNTQAADFFTKQAQRTMYGADLRGDISDVIAAVPDRKRDYFESMLKAPESDRDRILSTAGRLERRLLQSAWGMDVEQRPDLDTYFSRRELPGEDWEGWDPSVDMESIKIKVAQSAGLDLSQMGYYPQEIQQANAINPSYPDITQASASRSDTRMLLQRYMMQNGISGYVARTQNMTGRDNLYIDARVR